MQLPKLILLTPEVSEEVPLQELREITEEYRSLVKSPGWGRLLKDVERQMTARANKILLVPAAGMEGAMQKEYAAGEINGFMTAFSLAENNLNFYDNLIKERTEDYNVHDEE